MYALLVITIVGLEIALSTLFPDQLSLMIMVGAAVGSVATILISVYRIFTKNRR